MRIPRLLVRIVCRIRGCRLPKRRWAVAACERCGETWIRSTLDKELVKKDLKAHLDEDGGGV